MTARIDVVDGLVVIVVPASAAEQLARTILAAGSVLSRDDPGWSFDASIQALIGLLGECGLIADVGNVVADARRRLLESTMTTDEVAEVTGLSPRRVRQLAVTGELTARQAGSGWLIHRDAVTEFIDNRRARKWAS